MAEASDAGYVLGLLVLVVVGVQLKVLVTVVVVVVGSLKGLVVDMLDVIWPLHSFPLGNTNCLHLEPFQE